MSKFFKDADFSNGESAAKAHAGYLDFVNQKIEERGVKAPVIDTHNPSSPLAGKILAALHEHGAHRDGNVSLTETANVLATSVAKQDSFSAKVRHIEMMVGPHVKKEGEMRANPDLLKAVVGSILKVTDPPPPPKSSRGPGGP
ncbi:MAG: hypothetical protein ACK4PK_05645 [Alphaproteobacteria bacterium]